jgi:hypothetical protein
MMKPHGSSKKSTGTKSQAKAVRKKRESYESPAQYPRIRQLFAIFKAGRFLTLRTRGMDAFLLRTVRSVTSGVFF